MKKYFFLFCLFLNFYANGQDGLLIKNNKNGKAWMYEVGSTVTYIKFNEEEYSSGVLKALIDTSAVVFGKDTVQLKDIAGIRKKSPLHTITRIIGMPLMLVGSLIMGDALSQVYSNPSDGDGIKYFLVGAGIFAVGYLPYQLNLQDLTVGLQGEWSVAIKRDKH